MGKRKSATEFGTKPAQPVSTATNKVARKAEPARKTAGDTATITVPIGSPLADDTYVPEMIQKFRIYPKIAVAVKRLNETLDRSNATLSDGTRVRPNYLPDAIRWLLEQVAEIQK